MNKIILFFCFFLVFNINAQVDNRMKSDTIKISDNITLFQKKENLKDPVGISWELCISNKKEKKEILLETSKVYKTISSSGLHESNDLFLDIPNLVYGFKESDNVYAFIFIERALWLYRYHFIRDKFDKERVKVMEMTTGSMDNFGIPKFDVIKYIVGNEYFFNVSHSRVGRQGSNLVKLNMNKFGIKEIVFTDKIVKIKDDGQFIRTLDLDKNVEKLSVKIKKVLIDNKFLDKINNFKYLGNIDISDFNDDEKYKIRATGITYFIYQDNNLIKKIIRYNNYNSEWLIGEYKEEEIKQP